MATNVAIQHPNVFYFVFTASWSLNNSLEFWNKGNTATSANNNAVYKTIYSPSLSYFVEPQTAVYTGFSKTSGYTENASLFNVYGQFNKGWNFYCQPYFSGSTIFFCSLGFRNVNNASVSLSNAGAIFAAEFEGDYWSSTPAKSSTNAGALAFYPSYLYTLYEGCRAYGFAVRSIIE